MITRKNLRDMGKNNEEVDRENVSEYAESSDNLEDDTDYWALMLLYLLWMQEHENEKLWKNFQNDIKHHSRFFQKVSCWKK